MRSLPIVMVSAVVLVSVPASAEEIEAAPIEGGEIQARPADAAAGEHAAEEWLAIGAGVAFPSDILVFNRFSAKARFASFQLEPFVTARLGDNLSRSKIELGGTTDTARDTTKSQNFGVGAAVYVPLAAKGDLELLGVGSAAVTTARTVNDPDGDDNTTTSSNSVVSASFGLAIEWWLTSRLSLAASATNPLVSVVRQTTRQELGPDAETEQTTRGNSYGITWNPTVAATLFLWF